MALRLQFKFSRLENLSDLLKIFEWLMRNNSESCQFTFHFWFPVPMHLVRKTNKQTNENNSTCNQWSKEKTASCNGTWMLRGFDFFFKKKSSNLWTETWWGIMTLLWCLTTPLMAQVECLATGPSVFPVNRNQEIFE